MPATRARQGAAARPSATIWTALEQFQKDPPEVTKDEHARIPTKKKDGTPGQPYEYDYTSLKHLTAQVRPKLGALGLVWTTWPTTIGGDNGRPSQALGFKLHHVPSGEAIEDTMLLQLSATASPQDHGGAMTYARRQSLIAVLNLAPDKDEDGAQSAAASEPPPAARRSGSAVTKRAAESLYDRVAAAKLIPRLRLAMTTAYGEDVGPLDTKAKAVRRLAQLDAEQVARVTTWIERMEQRQLDAPPPGEGSAA